ncbi:hypothetical protein ACLKA7_000309 [Drosophila subpalustris]
MADTRIVLLYLGTGLCRIIYAIILITVQIIRRDLEVSMYIVEGIVLIVGPYFWICALSWIAELEQNF